MEWTEFLLMKWVWEKQYSVLLLFHIWWIKELLDLFLFVPHYQLFLTGYRNSSDLPLE